MEIVGRVPARSHDSERTSEVCFPAKDHDDSIESCVAIICAESSDVICRCACSTVPTTRIIEIYHFECCEMGRLSAHPG